MSSKPSSRLSKKQSYLEPNPSLKSKIHALEGKYNEFISNCSNFLHEDPKQKSEFKPQISLEKISSIREPLSENYKELLKIRKENIVLTKTVQELSSKISNIEETQAEIMINKQFQDNFEAKKRLLDKQEQDIFQLKQELEKTKVELNFIKNRSKEQAPQNRSATPLVKNLSKYTKLQLSKPKEYTPIERRKNDSPISRSISPKEKLTHNTKKQLSSLKQELEKTKEERNLYKS